MKSGIKILALLALLVFALALVIYVYPYAESYTPVESYDKREKLPLKGDPILYAGSGDWVDDYRRMIAQNFILLGTSGFESGPIGSEAALTLAKMIGAQVVLIDRRYADNNTKSIPFGARLQVSKDTSDTAVSSSNIKNNPATNNLGNGEEATFIPPIIANPDYGAQFWARAKIPVFGANFLNVGKTDGDNGNTETGVKIYLIIRNSPAHHGNVRINDLITHVNGTPVINVENFMEVIAENAGNEIILSVIRVNRKMTLPVRLNKNE
jgi:PDZ domain-containing protein